MSKTTHRTGNGYHGIEKQGADVLLNREIFPAESVVLTEKRAFIDSWKEWMKVSEIRKDATIQMQALRKVKNALAS